MALITEAYVNQFRNVIEMFHQQEGSLLMPTVRVENQIGEIQYFDRQLPRKAQEVVGRNPLTVTVDGEYDRRANRFQRFGDSVHISPNDVTRMLANPINSESMSIAHALGRQKDELIIKAATGTAYGGKDGLTPVAFDTTKRIPVNFGEAPPTNVGLTLRKLKEARLRLRVSEFILPNEQAFCVLGARQMDNLLSITEATSTDYNTQRTLVNGRVDSFMGFKFIELELLNKVVVGPEVHAEVLFYVPRSILMGVSKDMEVTMDRDFKVTNSTLIQAYMQCGSTRMWEDGVVTAMCKE